MNFDANSTENGKTSSEMVQRRFKHACMDIAEYIRGSMLRSSSSVQVRLVLNNKMQLAEDALEELLYSSLPIMSKVKTLSEGLQVLDGLLNFVSSKPPFQLAWLRLMSLISSIKNHIALFTLNQRNNEYYETIASLLSQLLMNIIDPVVLPKLPDFDSLDFRSTFVALVNTLQDITVMFDVLIESLPFIEREEILKWLDLDLKYYQYLFKVIQDVFSPEFFAVYERTREGHLFFDNFFAVHLNYVNFVMLMQTVYRLFGDDWAGVVDLRGILPSEYSHDFRGVCQFSFDMVAQGFQNLERWIRDGEIRVEPNFRFEDSGLYMMLKTGWYIIRSFLQRDYVYQQVFRFGWERFLRGDVSFQERENLRLMFDEYIFLLEIILSQIRGDVVLSEEFFFQEEGKDYLDIFVAFLEAIVLEAITVDSKGFYERLRPYHEVFIYASVEQHPLLWLEYELLMAFLMGVHGLRYEVRERMSKLEQLKTSLRGYERESFSLSLFMLYLLWYFSLDTGENGHFSLLKELREEVKQGKVPLSFKRAQVGLLDKIEAFFSGEQVDFTEYYSRLEVNIHDYATWVVPQFSREEGKQGGVGGFMYFPFHREQDRLV